MEKEEEKLAEEFALSSFPGFIFRASSAKLSGISLVPFSSDNAALAALRKRLVNEKTCVLSGKREMQVEIHQRSP